MNPAPEHAVDAAATDPVRRGWAALLWYVRGVLQEDAYAKYLLRHARTGCSTTPMGEREYWRARADWQERNPQGRCC